MMKDYKRLVKRINKSRKFELVKSGRKSTYKLVHLRTKNFYTIHPGDKAVKPVERWISKYETIS